MRLLASLALVAAAAAGDAKEEAWFAFRAGEQGDKEAVPRLLEALEKEPAARRWVLDALIRLEGEAPAAGVAGLFRDFPEETLILLARDPKNEEHWAAIAEASGASDLYLHWVAACNLLAARKSKLLAAPLLRDLELKVEIWVMDPHRMGGRGGRSRGPFSKTGHGVGDPDWPPVPVYGFSELQGGGAVAFAPGRQTIFHVRRVVQPREQRQSVRFRGTRHEHRVGYLGDLLGVEPRKLGFFADGLYTFPWSDAHRFARDVVTTRERVEKAYSDAVAQLVEKGLLDPQAAPKAPRIKVQVTDYRTDKSVALPALQGVQTKTD